MLQCLLADSTAYSNAHFGQGSTIIIAMDNVACTGSEATLFSCTHTTSHNCGHHEDAGVQCVPREFFFIPLCMSVMQECMCMCVCVCCQPWNFYCLTIVGCTHGTTRLIGGTSSLEGRVEVCVNGLWGTVCSHGWTARDANVACRQLSYSGSGM